MCYLYVINDTLNNMFVIYMLSTDTKISRLTLILTNLGPSRNNTMFL